MSSKAQHKLLQGPQPCCAPCYDIILEGLHQCFVLLRRLSSADNGMEAEEASSRQEPTQGLQWGAGMQTGSATLKKKATKQPKDPQVGSTSIGNWLWKQPEECNAVLMCLHIRVLSFDPAGMISVMVCRTGAARWSILSSEHPHAPLS